LSENASFCKAIADTPGLTFVGPGLKAITAMGSKSESKAIMENAGVPTTPGFYENVTTNDGEGQDPEKLLHEAVQIGFPLLIKAVMGGGGKGMRMVWSEKEFLDKLESCQRESLNSFGDSRVLLEKYLMKPRHVEVQVVADHHGNVVHLYERDCSLQRRHQKIIEEAPASDLPPALREQFGEMGKRAAQAVGYVNAGTVEFLLDTQEAGKFYFCEMNTRLQVEHPITELVTGVDLVEWQLRVAAGQELPIRNQEDIPCYGHAFEARIYAENPARNFLPATGKVWHHKPPATPNGEGVVPSGGVRVDTGIQAGQDVGVYYDPMICKLIVHDDTREAALQKLVTSLKQYQIAGVPTNIDFLVRCAQHQGFQKAGEVNTGFLEDYMDDVLPPTPTSDGKPAPTLASSSSPLSTAVGVFITMLQLEGRIGILDLESERRKHSSPWNSLSGSWTLGGRAQRSIQLSDGASVTCTSLRDGSFEISIPSSKRNDNDDKEEEEEERTVFHLNGTLSSDGHLDVVVDHTQRISGTAALHHQSIGSDVDSVADTMFHVCIWPQSAELFHSQEDYAWNVFVENPLSVTKSHHGSVGSGAAHGSIKAPMPGKVSRINVSIGDTVEEGDVLILMEAMKMEHPILSPVSGILTELSCALNDIVSDGAKLAVVENPNEEDEAA
jgi:3-methylcrotonyl-CoA carboxylase alpha subunit